MPCIWEGFLWLNMTLGYLGLLSPQHLKQFWGALVKKCLNSVSIVISAYWVSARARRRKPYALTENQIFPSGPISFSKEAFGFLVVLFSHDLQKGSLFCHAISCHDMSLQIAYMETSNEFTTFGRIFIRTYRNIKNMKNAWEQILPSSNPSLRLLWLAITVCHLLITIQNAYSFSFKISYLLTSFYYKVLYISSILAGGHTGVVTFLV